MRVRYLRSWRRMKPGDIQEVTDPIYDVLLRYHRPPLVEKVEDDDIKSPKPKPRAKHYVQN
jgi:hypothetical protein